MARDYKNRAAPRKQAKRQPVKGWVWFVSGFLVGVFACGLAWLKFDAETVERPRPAIAKKSVAPSQSKAAESKKGDAASPKPRFDFYTILPEMEVVVPDPEPEPVKSAGGTVQASGAPIVTTPNAAYMLQMGSFRKHSDADRLKASLALVGLEAEIQKFALDGGVTVYRVRSGPYTRDQVNKLRSRLSQNKISSLVIKLKK